MSKKEHGNGHRVGPLEIIERTVYPEIPYLAMTREQRTECVKLARLYVGMAGWIDQSELTMLYDYRVFEKDAKQPIGEMLSVSPEAAQRALEAGVRRGSWTAEAKLVLLRTIGGRVTHAAT
jgi:hypothetical protein